MVVETLVAFNLWTVLLMILLLVVTLVVKSWLDTPPNLPPLPARPYPLLGHLPYLKAGPREVMAAWRDKVGDIFTIYMGAKRVIVLNGLDVIKEALVKQADLFSDRPLVSLSRMKNATKGIIGASGPDWKEQRSVSLSILRDFGMGRNSLAEKVTEEAEAYLDRLARLEGKPTNVRTMTNAAVSNIICSIIVGQRFAYDDPYFLKFLSIITEQIRLLDTVSPIRSYTWLRYVPGDPFKIGALDKNDYALNFHFSNVYISKQSPGGVDSHVESFITSYLREMKTRQDKGLPTSLDGENLRRVIVNLFIAGTETTSTTMLWFMLYMLHYPDVLKTAQKELDSVVGRDRAPNFHDRPKLNYFNAVLMETQRMSSIAPFSLPHCCSADTTINGYTIPKGTTVFPVLDSLLLDSKTWGDPKNFRPERFLDKEGTLQIPEFFMPFSLGRRVCLGESLAKMELFLFLSSLVQRFDLQPATPGHLPPVKATRGVTCPPAEYELKFVAR